MHAPDNAPATALAYRVSIVRTDTLASDCLIARRDLFEALVCSPVVPVAGMPNLHTDVRAFIAACFESMVVSAHEGNATPRAVA